MAVETKRLAKGIYCAVWLGIIKIDEVFIAGDEIHEMAIADEIAQYVVVIDGTDAKNIPFNVRLLTQATHSASLIVLGYNPPFAGEMISRMFNKVMPIDLELYTDWDKLMARAETVLAEADLES